MPCHIMYCTEADFIIMCKIMCKIVCKIMKEKKDFEDSPGVTGGPPPTWMI